MQFFGYLMLADPVEKNGSKFKSQDGEVEDYTPNNLEHDGMMLPYDQRMPEGMRFAYIKEDTHRNHDVSEVGSYNGWPGNGLIFFHIENVHCRSYGKPPGCQRNTYQDIKGNPKTPRVKIVEIGCRSKSEKQAVHGNASKKCNQGKQNFGAA